MIATNAVTTVHACDESLGALLRDLLQEWAETQPEYCRRIQFKSLSGLRAYQVQTGNAYFDVATCHPWQPSESELAIIDRAVFKAATDRGWKSSVVPEFFADTERVFLGKTILGDRQYVCTSECCEGAIARLQSYLAANRGDY